MSLYDPPPIKPAVIFKKGEFETSKEYENRVKGFELTYVFSASLGSYDADSGGFEGNIKNTRFFAKVPREKAKNISGKKDKIMVQGILRYYSPESVILTDASFFDIETKEIFAVLNPVSETAAAYVPKPVIKETVVENIRDIPDFKSPPMENDIAVVIGIEKYRSIPKSDYSRNDAGVVKDYLKALGFQERNINFLPDEQASLSDIKKTIETWLPNRAKKNSRVVIYYSGHGAPEPKTGDAYLVPFDGDPNYLEDTGYSLKRLYDKLGKLQAAEVIVLLDSCFSGSGGRSVLAKGARPLVMMVDTSVLSSNMAVLSATQGTQISTSSPEKGHGVFTYYFLKALKDGKKDIAEIYEYIKPQVEDEAKQLNVQQSPSISPDVEKLKGRFGLRK